MVQWKNIKNSKVLWMNITNSKVMWMNVSVIVFWMG